MLRIWNICQPRQRGVFALTAGVVGLWSAAGLGIAQERPSLNFQMRFSGERPLPIFTHAPIRFGGALTSGFDWNAAAVPSFLLDPTPTGSLDAPSARLQPNNREAASGSTEDVSVGSGSDPDLPAETTPVGTKHTAVGSTGGVRPRRDRPIGGVAAIRHGNTGGRAATEKREEPTDADRTPPSGTRGQVADRPEGLPVAARSKGRHAGRSAEAKRLPSALRLED